MTDSKQCRGCKEQKPITDFHSCERSRQQSRCKKCKSLWAKKYYAENEHVRNRSKWGRYGITEAERVKIRSFQDGKCAVCKDTLKGGKREHIDHCHDTGIVRGILCSECNTGIGKLGDSAELLRIAANYLEQNFDVPAWVKQGMPI